MTKNDRQADNQNSRPHYKWELLGLLFLAFFLNQGDRAIFGVVLSAIKTDLGLSDSQLGLVGSVLFATLALLMPVAGYLGDVLNRKKIIVCSLFFWSAATMCTGLAGGVVWLIVFRSVATAGGESFYAPAAYPLLASHHKRTRALALSVHQSSLYVGVITSGFLGGFIAERWGWRSAFYIFGAAGIVLGLILIWRLLDAPPVVNRLTGGSHNSFGDGFRVLFRSRTALLLTTGFTAIIFVNNAYVVWAPIFLQEKFHLSLGQAGGYAMFFHHIAALIGIMLGGWMSDRLVVAMPGFRLVLMATAMLLGVPVIFLMGHANSLVIACTMMAGFGLFRGLYESNTHAALFQVIAPQYRASAVAIMSMLAFLIGSVSPWMLGNFRECYPVGQGLGHGFSVLSVAYLIGGLAVVIAARFTFNRDHCSEEPIMAPGIH